MERIYQELVREQDVRTNLSNLRKMLKDEEQMAAFLKLLGSNQELLTGFLKSEDAKTRKNAALLLGDLALASTTEALLEAYRTEGTRFVRSAYLTALLNVDVEPYLNELREQRDRLLAEPLTEENRKHVEEELRELRKLLISYEGITKHTFDPKGKEAEVILLVNRNHREFIKKQIPVGTSELHPMGILVKTDDLLSLMQMRTYRELVFPVSVEGTFVPAEPQAAAEFLWKSNLLDILQKFHKEDTPFYFRVECKGAMSLEEKSAFTKKLGSSLELQSKGKLVNSTTDYEIELRLVQNKEGAFFPCLKMNTMRNTRFAYRKNSISASIHPSTAALIMELAKPYLKEQAQIMDPFCGVGTMLIERDICVPAREIYGTDIFGEAIEKGRVNARCAGERINFIQRDFFDFKHEYKFDEIITNMPVRGKKSKEELDQLYAAFFRKALTILEKEAVIVMYTNEVGFVKKQLRLHKEYRLLQETCMQSKTDFYLMIIGVKR